MAPLINMVDAFKFYKGTEGQAQAAEYLNKILSEEEKAQFQQFYRQAPPAPPEKPKGDIYIYAKWSGEYDDFGLKVFGMYLMNGDKAVDKLPFCSGQSWAQDVVWPTDDTSGSMRPLPEGIYDLGAVDDLGYDPGASDGYGQWVYPLEPRAPIQRSLLRVHSDRNRPTSPGCFDIEETEVLTPSGWVSAKEITVNSEVFQMGNNFELVKGFPTKVIRQEYEGEMILITSNKMSMLVTPDHRIAKTSRRFIENWKDSKPRIGYFHAKELVENEFAFSVPTAGVYSPDVEWTEETIAFERLHIAFLADGYHVAEQTCWHFRKQRKIERLQSLLFELNIAFNVYPQKDGTTVIKIPKVHQFSKDISPEYALSLPLEVKTEMLKEIIHWDGASSSGKSKQAKICCHVGTTKKNQAEFYRLLAVTSGWGCKISEWVDSRNKDWSVLYRCNLIEGRIRYGIETKQKLGSLDVGVLDDYVGTVFCLETEHSNFIVKHRGEVFITGNSAGCATPYTVSQMFAFVGWTLQKNPPKYFVMDHGLGFLLKEQGFTPPNVGKP